MWTSARSLVGLGVFLGSGVSVSKLLQARCTDEKMNEEQMKIEMCPYVTWDFNWDKRAVFQKPKPGSPIQQDPKHCSPHNKNIYCIASLHESEFELGPPVDHAKPGSPLGRQQADRLMKLFRSEGIQLHRIYHSPEFIDKGLAMEYMSEFLEPKEDPLLSPGFPDFAMPEESWGGPEKFQVFEDSARLEAAFRAFFHRLDTSAKEPSNEIIIASPEVIKFFICRALQFPPQAYTRFTIQEASVTILSISGDGVVTAKSIGDTGHLSRDLLVTRSTRVC